jgi:hypothetical protein
MIGFASPLLAATGEAAKAGPLAIIVIAVLCIACYFLFRSMSRHLRKVREQFPGDQRPEQRGDGTSDAPPQSGATPKP